VGKGGQQIGCQGHLTGQSDLNFGTVRCHATRPPTTCAIQCEYRPCHSHLCCLRCRSRG
jgi:hypothetical protein